MGKADWTFVKTLFALGTSHRSLELEDVHGPDSRMKILSVLHTRAAGRDARRVGGVGSCIAPSRFVSEAEVRRCLVLALLIHPVSFM